jgi:hypothetical protein
MTSSVITLCLVFSSGVLAFRTFAPRSDVQTKRENNCRRAKARHATDNLLRRAGRLG